MVHLTQGAKQPGQTLTGNGVGTRSNENATGPGAATTFVRVSRPLYRDGEYLALDLTEKNICLTQRPLFM